MALLNNITYSPGEPMQDCFDKINAAIDAINTALGGTNNLKIKVVEMGDWNMDSTTEITVPHGVSDFKKIRSITAIIRDDNDANYYPCPFINVAGSGSGYGFTIIDASNIVIDRVTAGVFDSTDFNATSFNRGWITIIYTE